MRRWAAGLFTNSGSPPRQAAAPPISVVPPVNPAETKMAAEAAQRAEDADNRVFHLERPASAAGRPVRIAVFGCHGDGSKSQAEVADALHAYLKVEGNAVDFVLLLGDNCYDYGPDSATDPLMHKCFGNMYPKRHQNLRLAYYALAGNHDKNNQKYAKRILCRETGDVRLMHEIGHTFTDIDTNEYRGNVNKLYNQPLSPTEQQAGMRTVMLESLVNQRAYWNMPRRYYSLVIENTQIFCLDSNTYARDYLILMENRAKGIETSPKENQAAWFEIEVEKANAAGRTVVLAQHHPLYTPGKRAFHNDHNIYLEKDEITRLKDILKMSEEEFSRIDLMSYNTLLLKCFIKQGFSFDRQQLRPDQNPNRCIDTVLSAHDHHFCYYNNKATAAATQTPPMCQIIFGTGGGEQQDRFKFSDQNEMGGFLKTTGFGVLIHPPHQRHLNFEFVSSSGEHVLRYNTLTKNAYTCYDEKVSEADAIKMQLFLLVIERAIYKYLLHIGDKQDEDEGSYLGSKMSPHGHEGTNRAHKLWAFLMHAHPKTNLNDLVNHVLLETRWKDGSIIKNLTSAKDHSLITMVNEEMEQAYGKTIEEYAQMYGDMLPAYCQTMPQIAINYQHEAATRLYRC